MPVASAPNAPLAAPTRPPVEVAFRRLLRIPADRPRGTRRDAQRAFSTSILISAVRCILTYIVLPFLAPAFGIAKGVGPLIGIPVGAVAIVFNVLSIRRFFAADHKWRWGYAVIGLSVIGLLVVLIARDLGELLG